MPGCILRVISTRTAIESLIKASFGLPSTPIDLTIPVAPSCDKPSASLFLIQFPHPAARGPVNLLPENRGVLASPRIRLLTLRHRTFYRRYPSIPSSETAALR